MEEIKALDARAGRSIGAVVAPTYKIWGKQLSQPANKAAILTIPSTTESYGPHPRQKLDIYKAPHHSSSTPILIFFYGGGFVRGDKISPMFNLVYHNVGAFFAARGITTAIPDYRRVNSEIGGEDAVFPSGAEDISLALKWVEKLDAAAKRTVYLLGNSAGGVHMSTFLLEPRFLEQRKKYIAGDGSILLKGAIAMAVPFHFKERPEERDATLKLYYGSIQGSEENSAFGLLEKAVKTFKSRGEAGVPPLLALIGEWDPDDEIVRPLDDFVEVWKKNWSDIRVEKMMGHNHISPPLSLNGGESAAEKWAEDVASLIKSQASPSPSL